MRRLALLMAVLLALPVAADTPAGRATPAGGAPAPAASPAPKSAPATDEGELDEFVPSEKVPADASVAFPHDI